MSCMIQKPENTAMIASYIARLLNMGHEVNGMNCPESLGRALKDLNCCDRYDFYDDEKIYNELIKLNCMAFYERYKLEDKEFNIPKYKWNDISRHTDYICTENKSCFFIEQWHYKILKMIQFYNYQCNEDATYKSDLYNGMTELESVLCHFIVENSTEYIKQEWE